MKLRRRLLRGILAFLIAIVALFAGAAIANADPGRCSELQNSIWYAICQGAVDESTALVGGDRAEQAQNVVPEALYQPGKVYENAMRELQTPIRWLTPEYLRYVSAFFGLGIFISLFLVGRNAVSRGPEGNPVAVLESAATYPLYTFSVPLIVIVGRYCSGLVLGGLATMLAGTPQRISDILAEKMQNEVFSFGFLSMNALMVGLNFLLHLAVIALDILGAFLVGMSWLIGLSTIRPNDVSHKDKLFSLVLWSSTIHAVLGCLIALQCVIVLTLPDPVTSTIVGFILIFVLAFTVWDKLPGTQAVDWAVGRTRNYTVPVRTAFVQDAARRARNTILRGVRKI